MWNRGLLTSMAVGLAISGTTVLAGLLNRAAPAPVDSIGVEIEPSGMAEPPEPSLSSGPAIPVSPAPVTLGSVDHDDGAADLDDADDTKSGGFPTGVPTTTVPASPAITIVDEADDDSSAGISR